MLLALGIFVSTKNRGKKFPKYAESIFVENSLQEIHDQHNWNSQKKIIWSKTLKVHKIPATKIRPMMADDMQKILGIRLVVSPEFMFEVLKLWHYNRDTL